MKTFRNALLAGAALLSLTPAARADDDRDGGERNKGPKVDHVLLISVDGMHKVDLEKWIIGHPSGALAGLAARGTIFNNAYTTAPSDSFPGMIAQVTGGTPYSAGVFYDDSYDRTFFAPDNTTCAGTPGAEVMYAENIDKNTNDVNAGGTPTDQMSQISTGKLPRTLVDGKCVAVQPHQFIRVNTIFEVLRAHGKHTAWSDKHPAYEILNGPSGTGIEDLYTPEINSQLPGGAAGDDFTKSFAGVRSYDQIKVNAILNQIAGKKSDGSSAGYVPAVFGMNFQAVSVGQKLPKSSYKSGSYASDDGLLGGYLDAAGTPNTGLAKQLQFIDDSIGAMVSALYANGVYYNTAVIVSAKHGQSPIDLNKLNRIPDTYSTVLANDGFGFNIADDASLIWLDPSKRSPATLRSTVTDLNAAKAALGIDAVLGRNELRRFFRDPATDSRTPDFFVVSHYGVVYTGGKGKIAEHGGVADDDRHVALLVSASGLRGNRRDEPVLTTQIAPTILNALGVSARELDAVKIEGTQALPLSRDER